MYYIVLCDAEVEFEMFMEAGRSQIIPFDHAPTVVEEREYDQLQGWFYTGIYEADTSAAALEMALDNYEEWIFQCVG